MARLLADTTQTPPLLGPSPADVEALYRRYAPVIHARAR